MYREEHREDALEYSKQYYTNNSEDIKYKNKLYRQEHVEEIRERDNMNRHKLNAKEAKRRSIKAESFSDLDCIDKEAIDFFYEEARRISEGTGIPHQVDHIVALNSPYDIIGEHAPWNMQILTAEDNMKKGNRSEDIIYEYVERISKREVPSGDHK